MIMLLKILILTLLSSKGVDCKKDKSCKDLIVDVAHSNAAFLQCATNNGVPVTICVSCVEEYRNVEHDYANFFKGNDSTGSCPSIYVDKDKLNIIAHSHEIIKNLWSEAFCNNCFNPDGTTKNETAKFDTLEIDYLACQSSNMDFCSNCKRFYVELNQMFEELREKYKSQVCFDIQDKMNRTRGNWTAVCGHETPNASLMAFAAVSSSLMSIPVLFYCGFFFFTRRQEQNYENLDSMAEHEPENSVLANDQEQFNTPSTSNGITTNNIDTGTSSKSKLIDINTSDDEDLLH